MALVGIAELQRKLAPARRLDPVGVQEEGFQPDLAAIGLWPYAELCLKEAA